MIIKAIVTLYETVRTPEVGERLVCKKDDREEAAVYDTNAIGIYIELNTDEGLQVIPVGHLLIEFLFLMNYFLKSSGLQKLLGQEKEKMDWLYLVYIIDVYPCTKLQKHHARLANCMHTCKLKYRTLPLLKSLFFEN